MVAKKIIFLVFLAGCCCEPVSEHYYMAQDLFDAEAEGWEVINSEMRPEVGPSVRWVVDKVDHDDGYGFLAGRKLLAARDTWDGCEFEPCYNVPLEWCMNWCDELGRYKRYEGTYVP